jgi:hypothetical protein
LTGSAGTDPAEKITEEGIPSENGGPSSFWKKCRKVPFFDKIWLYNCRA